MLPPGSLLGAGSVEIDILEVRGPEPQKILGTLHYGARWPANTHNSQEFILSDNGTEADFHVDAMEFELGEFRWFVDVKQFAAQSF